ncbi:APC family permease [Halomarina salina]|uniref:APC family permease n=1 Tax=Halomarina salina TaxID=1872699 RepID=A0ABD5RTM5_9EURY|nr:APC family permease [Halomarina salina]
MTDQPASESTDHLGLFDCLLLSVGGMIGSAIFVFPGSTGRLAGPAAPLAWLLAGLLMTAIALCYTELTLAFPRTGALAIFPYETLGPSTRLRAFASYLEGVGYAIGWVFGITVSALAIAGYLGTVVPAAAGHTTGVALAAVALVTAINLLGGQVTSRLNLLLTAVLLAVLVAFVAVATARVDPARTAPLAVGGPASFLAAVQISMTAYGAWTVVPAAIGEIREPAYTAPRAILLSLGVTTVLYALVVFALHGVVPVDQFLADGATLRTPLATAATILGVEWLRYALALGSVAAIFTTMLVGTMSASRVLFALGQNGTLPSPFASVTTGTGVPSVGVVAVGGSAAVLSLFPGYFYELLVVASIVGTGIPYGINLLSFLGLRRYRTDVQPSFRVPAGHLVAGVAGVGLVVAMVGLGLTEVVWSTVAIALLTGYYAIRRLFGSSPARSASS